MARKCGKCGASLFPTDTFCGLCGSPVGDEKKADEALSKTKKETVKETEPEKNEPVTETEKNETSVEAEKAEAADKVEKAEAAAETEKAEPEKSEPAEKKEAGKAESETSPEAGKSEPENSEDTDKKETGAEPENTEKTEAKSDKTEAESEKTETESEAEKAVSEEKTETDYEEEVRIARENAERLTAESIEAEMAVKKIKEEAGIEDLSEIKNEVSKGDKEVKAEFIDSADESSDGTKASGDDFERVIRAKEPDPDSKKKIRDIILLIAGIAVLAILLAFLLHDDVKDMHGNDSYHDTNSAANNDEPKTNKLTEKAELTEVATAATATPTPTKVVEDYVPSDKNTAWDASVAKKFADGDGTQSTPYKITCGSELAFLAEEVNRGVTFEDNYFILENDIDLALNEWIPIGYYYADEEKGNLVYSFNGHFNGNGHKVTNVQMKNMTSSHELPAYSMDITVGLFGALSGAEISGLTIENCTISFTRAVEGEVLAGVLAGYAGSSKITDCSVNGTISVKGHSRTVGAVLIGAVSDSEIKNVTIDGSVSLGNDSDVNDAGLAAGYAVKTSFESVTASGKVSSANETNAYVGGLVGYSSEIKINGGSINATVNAETTGSESFLMAGGVAGAYYNSADIDVKAETDVTAKAVCDLYAGGAYGYNEASEGEKAEYAVKVSASLSGKSGLISAGGVCGYSSNADLHGTRADGEITTTALAKNYSGGLIGSGKHNSVYDYTIDVDVNAEATDTEEAEVMAGGITGNNTGATYLNVTVSGDVKLESAVDGYAGGAFGYINGGNYENVKAEGEISNKSTTGVSTGGFAGYSATDYIMSGCSGSTKRTNEGKNVYDNELIALEAEKTQ